MIKSLHVKGFTVFKDAKFTFSSGLNVIIGENGTGKTHLLKLAYTLGAVSHASRAQPTAGADPSTTLQVRVGEKLFGVFRPEELGHLVRNRMGSASVRLEGVSSTGPLAFELHAEGSVAVKKTPTSWEASRPAFLPTRELLSFHEGFVAANRERVLQFDDTWVDTSELLALPVLSAPVVVRLNVRGKEKYPAGSLVHTAARQRLQWAQASLGPLEAIMGGKLLLDRSGRFYVDRDGTRTEITLIAEGHRKVGMLARLIANGSIGNGTTLFWDEPETNLNARVMKDVAKVIVDLAARGVQVILATHSLFLMREFEILLGAAKEKVPARWIGLQPGDDGVRVEQGDSELDLGDVAALDESLAQSDRFLAMEAGR